MTTTTTPSATHVPSATPVTPAASATPAATVAETSTAAPAGGVPDAAHLRYGVEPPAVLRTPTIDGQLAHRSVRRYLPDALDPDVVPTLVAAAQSAPTSSNLQVWSVVAVTEPALKERLSVLAGDQQHIRDAPLLLVWAADLTRARALAAAQQVHLEGADYLETTVVAVLDAALAAQNAVVAAESLGLGTVYIGGIRNRPLDVAAELGLPDGVVAVVGLVVGHPDPAAPAAVKPRLAQGAVLHHEVYDPQAAAAHVQAYEDALAPFYAREGLTGGWAERVVARLRTAASLHGRDRLREDLTARGFPSR